MARNTRASRGMKKKKIEPAVQTLLFSSPNVASGATGTFTVDISQCASLVNRRFYRQGINWAVAGIKISTPGIGSIRINKLPETWVMSNAWEKGFRTWQKMNDAATAESSSVKPKFLDFKIYADSIHHDAGFGANLLPVSGDFVSVAVPGEWVASKFVVPNGGTLNVSDREIIATGANYPGSSTATGLNAVSLIEGYAASRGLPNVLDPNAPADAADADSLTPENWMAALFNEGTQQDDEVLGDMISENNIAPYPFENDGVSVDTMYPGGANQLAGLQLHDFDTITTTTIGGNTYLKGGMFPCGLMRFDFTHDATSELAAANILIQVDLVPGDHRGYHCEPMTEM